MTTRRPTAHYHRSQQQEPAPALVLVGGDGQDARGIQQIGDGTLFSIRAEWSKARRRGLVATLDWRNGPLLSTRSDDDDDDGDDQSTRHLTFKVGGHRGPNFEDPCRICYVTFEIIATKCCMLTKWRETSSKIHHAPLQIMSNYRYFHRILRAYGYIVSSLNGKQSSSWEKSPWESKQKMSIDWNIKSFDTITWNK